MRTARTIYFRLCRAGHLLEICSYPQSCYIPLLRLPVLIVRSTSIPAAHFEVFSRQPLLGFIGRSYTQFGLLFHCYAYRWLVLAGIVVLMCMRLKIAEGHYFVPCSIWSCAPRTSHPCSTAVVSNIHSDEGATGGACVLWIYPTHAVHPP